MLGPKATAKDFISVCCEVDVSCAGCQDTLDAHSCEESEATAVLLRIIEDERWQVHKGNIWCYWCIKAGEHLK